MTPGRKAYEAFAELVYCRPWFELPQVRQDAWERAAEAVREDLLETWYEPGEVVCIECPGCEADISFPLADK